MTWVSSSCLELLWYSDTSQRSPAIPVTKVPLSSGPAQQIPRVARSLPGQGHFDNPPSTQLANAKCVRDSNGPHNFPGSLAPAQFCCIRVGE